MISAVASAASGFALAVMTGEGIETALQAAIEGCAKPRMSLRQWVSVNGAMTELLGNTALWDAFGTTAWHLGLGLLGDSTVQAALDAGISSAVPRCWAAASWARWSGPRSQAH